MLKSIFDFYKRLTICIEISRVASHDIDTAREMMRKEFC